jgi:[acyl-carrier-protein] S-malonyltransferase
MMKLNPQTTAFIFPGQGSQAVGMGSELALQFSDAKEIFDEADSALGLSLSKLMWSGPDTELNETVRHRTK